MFWVDVLFALSMALIFTMIFAAGLRRTGPWSSVAVFFLVIFLAAWAGGALDQPGRTRLSRHLLAADSAGGLLHRSAIGGRSASPAAACEDHFRS